jgi:hypothetical protein
MSVFPLKLLQVYLDAIELISSFAYMLTGQEGFVAVIAAKASFPSVCFLHRVL